MKPGPVPRSTHEHARAYAARGWLVFPCWPTGNGRPCACPDPQCGTPDPKRPGKLRGSPAKHPVGNLVPHGLQQATIDLEVVDRWWATYPEANVGIRMGAESGLMLLDIDGEAGRTSTEALLERYEGFSVAWVRTGSGGWHAYMAHPGVKVSNSAGRLGPGLDVRGDGGYAVAPPSRHHCGDRYCWMLGIPEHLPNPPAWLVDLLTPPPPPAARPIPLRSRGLTNYVLAAIEGEAHDVAAAPSGERNHRLNLAAWRLGRLLSGDPAERTAAEILLIAARTAGLGEHEAIATINSGLRASARDPRGAA